MAEGIWVPPGGSADPRRVGAEGREEERQGAGPGPSAEDVLEAIRRLDAAELVLSTATTLAQVAYAKLDAQSRDLPQARLAIEALRALVEVLAESVDEQSARDLRQVVANLQVAFADAAASPPPA